MCEATAICMTIDNLHENDKTNKINEDSELRVKLFLLPVTWKETAQYNS